MRLYSALFTALLVLSISCSYSMEHSCQIDSTQEPDITSSSSWWSLEPVLSSLRYVSDKVVTAKTAVDIHSALSGFGENLKQEIEVFFWALPAPPPRHIAIIMDGNRRYAQAQGLDQNSYGHFFGAARLLQTIRVAERLGISQLTVYALSTENFERPEEEVAVLMAMVKSVLEHWEQELINSTIKVQHLGFRTRLDEEVLQAIDSIVEKTRHHKGLTLNIAFNYGGQSEITYAVIRLIKKGLPATAINNKLIEQHLLTGELDHWTDPELVIRTGGRIRVSNFLPLQIRYSELYFADVLWPEFTPDEFMKAIHDYWSRKRNFGL